MNFPTLYKYNTKGSPIQWTIEVEDDKFRTLEGQVNGKITVSEYTTCLPKNTGKKNETTASEQALKEAIAKYNKKKEKGFSENLETSGTSWIEVMLAGKWNDYGELLMGKAVAIQPKLDGHRCVSYLQNSASYLQSRGGKEITSCDHLKPFLKNVYEKYPKIILDGELYNHHVPFETLCGLIRRHHSSKDSHKVQYHIYDVFGEGMEKATFSARHEFLKNIFAECNLPEDFFVLVETHFTTCQQVNLDFYENKYLEENYEGIMIRNPNSFYENKKRSKGLLKLKRFEDEEFTIVSINDGLGNRKNLATEVVVKLSDGREFSAGIMGQDEYVRQMFLDRERYVGKLATISRKDGIWNSSFS